MGLTSAKGNWAPKRVKLTCPNCGKVFSLMPADYRKVAAGKRGPCCSSGCGQQWRFKKPQSVTDGGGEST